jgi:exopolyphosphatase/guanosine-5'-triphosphate,3'-diphosphate pyrophosphatase
MAEIRPRWEWRTFGSHFGVAEERFGALEPTGVQESDELYLVSDTDANIKVRFDLLDLKVLVEVNEAGLEQWRPVMKAQFPASAEDVSEVLARAGISEPSLRRDRYSVDEFVGEVAEPSGELRPVQVHKRRVRYSVGGCTAEVTDVTANGVATRSIAIESEDADAVVAAVASMGLADYVNTHYGKGLAWLLNGAPERYAVVDVGTNSVKFHLAERAADGAWRRIADRAEMTRLGEGVEESGAVSDAAIARTADAVAGMADEARANGALAIAAVGTAVFRIANNGEAAVAAIRKRSGLTVQVISGDEESRLAYLAASSSISNVQGMTVVFDTGGGSSQFTFGHDGQIDDRFSVNVGAVSVTEQFGLAKAVPSETIEQAKASVAAGLSQLDGRAKPAAVVGMGGAITNMTSVSKSLAAYDPDQVQGATLTAAEIDRQIELYRTRSADERRSLTGLQPKRAEVILAGACIVRTIIENLGAQSLTVSDRGLRHGILKERFE